MLYEIRFDDEVHAAGLYRILGQRFGIAPAAIYVGRLEDRPITADRPVVVVTPPEDDEGFGWILTGDAELAEQTQLTELELAKILATGLGVRALVDDGTRHPDRWYLVARDGSYGRVITNEDSADEGDLRIQHALEPITR